MHVVSVILLGGSIHLPLTVASPSVCVLVLKLIRQAWQAASERLQGFDELSQASLRFRKTLPGEPPSTDPHVLQPFEVCRWLYVHTVVHMYIRMGEVSLGASIRTKALLLFCTSYLHMNKKCMQSDWLVVCF